MTLSSVNVAFAEAPKPYAPCTRQPTDTDIAGAKGAFQAGQASFDEADYRRAIDYWEDAYRRDCTAHALLLNLARAYELNGQKAEAIVALETYVERVPDTPDRDKIERRVDVLKRQLDEEQAATPPQPDPPAEDVQPTPAAPAPLVVQDAPVRQGKRPIVPLIVAGVGGAIAVVGGVLYASARSDLRDAESENACPNRVCPKNQPGLLEDAEDARTRVNVTGAVTIGGVAVLGAGIAWYFLSPRKPAPQAAVGGLVPVAAPGFAGLTYDGRF